MEDDYNEASAFDTSLYKEKCRWFKNRGEWLNEMSQATSISAVITDSLTNWKRFGATIEEESRLDLEKQQGASPRADLEQ